MKKNKTLVVALIITMLMAMCSVVNAASNSPAYSASFALSSDSKLEAGSTVVAKFKIASLAAGEGIDALVATLNYDSNVLEVAGQSSLVGNNGWTIGAYNASTHKFTMTNSSKVNSAQDILTITFNVKKDITASSTVISVKGISVSGGAANSGGTGDIVASDVNAKIQGAKTPSNPTTNTVDQTNTVSNTSGKTNTTKTNTTIKSKKLPQTGVDNMTISLVVLSAVVLGAVCYGKYKNLNKYVK